MTLFTYYKVTCNHTWDDEETCDTYSFASLEGAEKWVDNHSEDLRWYSIEGLEAHPCDDNDIGGQIFYGMIYHTFKELVPISKEEE